MDKQILIKHRQHVTFNMILLSISLFILFFFSLMMVEWFTIKTHPKTPEKKIYSVNQNHNISKISTYFAPYCNLEPIDISFLNMAATSKDKVVYIAMYAFTDKNIANEIIKLAKSGVKVEIYRDDIQMRGHTDVSKEFKGIKNISIREKKDHGFGNIMHDKFFIIPNMVFREGSANFSPSGEGALKSRKIGNFRDQDNTATYIFSKNIINEAVVKFQEMWNRKSNIIYQ